MKQKITLFVAVSGLTASLVAAILVAALPGSVVYAQPDPCSTVPGGWTNTREACENARENNQDPCKAIYDTLTADGNSEAEARRDACQAAVAESKKTSTDCEPGSEGCCGGVKTSIIGDLLCGDDTEGSAPQDSSIYKLLIGVLNIMTAGIAIAAVGGIAYGALLYTTAENKPDQTKKAIGIITNVVIGIVAYALMFVFLNFLIPGGIFT